MGTGQVNAAHIYVSVSPKEFTRPGSWQIQPHRIPDACFAPILSSLIECRKSGFQSGSKSLLERLLVGPVSALGRPSSSKSTHQLAQWGM
jgi:hypothetical protein